MLKVKNKTLLLIGMSCILSGIGYYINMNKSRKKILIMTSTGNSNLGDELILREEIGFIRSQSKNPEIIVSTYNQDHHLIQDPDGIKFISYFPNKIKSRFLQNIGYFINSIITIASSDILIIGGGGIIFDNEPGISFPHLIWQWLIRVKIARIARTPILFWGVSLEIKKTKNIPLLSRIFTDKDKILVRDTQSKKLLEGLKIKSTIIDDIVFLYENIGPKALPGVKKRVGISIRGGFLDSKELHIPQIYDSLVEMGYIPIFLVFSTEGNIDQNDSLYIEKIMAGRTYNITKNIQQTLDVFPFLYASIAMRFHAGVLSCVHESPCIHIPYGPKTEELIDRLDAEHLTIRPNEFSLDIFQDIWHNLEREYKKESDRLKKKNASIKKCIQHGLNVSLNIS